MIGLAWAFFHVLDKLESSMFERQYWFVWVTRREKKRRELMWTFKKG
jgi:hypothetical protein